MFSSLKNPRTPVKTSNLLKVCVITVAVLLNACATPTERIERQADRMNLVPLTLTAKGFAVRAFYGTGNAPNRVLHVYLEGDGAAWRRRQIYDPSAGCTDKDTDTCGRWRVRYEIPKDPTSRQPVMLPLLELDDTARLYLGRPCYMGFATLAPCTPELWTFKRYSTVVVDTLAEALETFLAKRSFQHIVWLGHSGGGTLAMLLAARFPQTTAVVTLAGNLDVTAWAAHHGYTPLTGSLDPAREPPLAPHIVQRHYLGALDPIITPQIVAKAVAKQPGAVMEVLPQVDHNRGWQHHWPAILSGLRDFENASAKRVPPADAAASPVVP